MDKKLKAKQLVERFKNFTVLERMTRSAAKQCALIHIEEAINDYSQRLASGKIDFITSPNPIEELEELKKEIQQL